MRYAERKTEVKVMPFSREAETALIGALIIRPEFLPEALEIIRSDDFHSPTFFTIFRVLEWLHRNNRGIEYLTIIDSHPLVCAENNAKKFNDRVHLADIHLEDLMFATENCPSAELWRDYAQVVVDRAKRRAAVTLGTRLSRMAQEGEPTDGLATAAGSLQELLARDSGQSPVKPIGDVLREMIDDWNVRHAKGNGLCGLSTGYDEIDRYTAGFEPGKLYVFAARPSHTKTSLAVNLALKIVAAGHGAFFVTSEIPNAGLCELMAGSLASVNTKRLKRGDASELEMARFTEATAKIVGMPIYCDDTPNVSVQSIYKRAKHLVDKMGVKIIFIDYLQRLRFDGIQKSWNEEREINEMCKALKTTARTLNVPVVLLAQLNRDVEKQGRQRYPKVSDCKGSGAIEQEADAIFLLWYGYKAGWPHNSPADEIDVILGKQRDGETGSFKLRFRGEFRRHENMPSREPRPPEPNYQDNDGPPPLSKP